MSLTKKGMENKLIEQLYNLNKLVDDQTKGEHEMLLLDFQI
jgi:hypothetical protein